LNYPTWRTRTASEGRNRHKSTMPPSVVCTRTCICRANARPGQLNTASQPSALRTSRRAAELRSADVGECARTVSSRRARRRVTAHAVCSRLPNDHGAPCRRTRLRCYSLGGIPPHRSGPGDAAKQLAIKRLEPLTNSQFAELHESGKGDSPRWELKSGGIRKLT